MSAIQFLRRDIAKTRFITTLEKQQREIGVTKITKICRPYYQLHQRQRVEGDLCGLVVSAGPRSFEQRTPQHNALHSPVANLIPEADLALLSSDPPAAAAAAVTSSGPSGKDSDLLDTRTNFFLKVLSNVRLLFLRPLVVAGLMSAVKESMFTIWIRTLEAAYASDILIDARIMHGYVHRDIMVDNGFTEIVFISVRFNNTVSHS
jgi:hypothetical protein